MNRNKKLSLNFFFASFLGVCWFWITVLCYKKHKICKLKNFFFWLCANPDSQTGQSASNMRYGWNRKKKKNGLQHIQVHFITHSDTHTQMCVVGADHSLVNCTLSSSVFSGQKRPGLTTSLILFFTTPTKKKKKLIH